jgi:hypothetical protein
MIALLVIMVLALFLCFGYLCIGRWPWEKP